MKRNKWYFLTTQVGYDKYTVPIYKSSARNRCVPLLKTLMSSFCSNNCKFCAFRCERRTVRERWESEELAKITMKLWKMRKIEGLFLSSAVEGDPDHIMEKELKTIELLRNMGFTSYIHIRVMPGTSRDLIRRAAELSDRIGLNIEMPTKEHYDDMKLYLTFIQDVVRRLKWIAKEVERSQKEGKCEAGLDSQMVIGASDETDREIIKMSDWLYNELNAQRVYYSRFSPVKNTPLQDKEPENPWREYRLYQSSFLLRDYGFETKDFVFDDNDHLNLKQDPKFLIAKESDLMIDINNTSFEELIKVPGIGLKTAHKIVENRPIKDLTTLRSIGVILKRASPFIEVNGTHQSRLSKWIS